MIFYVVSRPESLDMGWVANKLDGQMGGWMDG